MVMKSQDLLDLQDLSLGEANQGLRQSQVKHAVQWVIA
jgi:hypothetical protein